MMKLSEKSVFFDALEKSAVNDFYEKSCQVVAVLEKESEGPIYLLSREKTASLLEANLKEVKIEALVQVQPTRVVFGILNYPEIEEMVTSLKKTFNSCVEKSNLNIRLNPKYY